MATWRLLCCAAAATAVLAAGCSSSTPKPSPAASTPSSSSASTSAVDLGALTPQQLSDKAKQALVTASSFRIVGTTTDTSGTTTFGMSYATTGSSGSVSAQGFTFQLIKSGESIFLKAPEAFWRKEFTSQPSATAALALQLVKDKWIKLGSSNKTFSSIATLADRRTFVRELTSSDNGPAQVKVAGKTIDGVDTIGLRSVDMTVYVSAQDAKPIEIDPLPASGATGRLTFSEYGAVPEPTAPPAAEVIDASKLPI